MEQPQFSLPSSKQLQKTFVADITPDDIAALWRNPLFQRVRTEIENISTKTRMLNPFNKKPEEIQQKLMVLAGMEKVLEMFDDGANAVLGRGKKTEEQD